MIQQDSQDGPVWMFDDAECADYAYICACLPEAAMKPREVDFLRKVEIKFRRGGGFMTQGQWDWFAQLATRHGASIMPANEVASAARELAREMSR